MDSNDRKDHYQGKGLENPATEKQLWRSSPSLSAQCSPSSPEL